MGLQKKRKLEHAFTSDPVGLPTPDPSEASSPNPPASPVNSQVISEIPSKRVRVGTKAQAIPLRRSARIKARLPDTRNHVNRMPTEILITIFTEVQKALKTQKYTLEPSVKTVCNLAHVCTRWRDVMINCPPHMSLYSVFDDRNDESEVEVPEIKRSTIGPEALANFVQEFRTRELASFVFAGKSKKVFDFGLQQRNKSRRELEVKRLWFLGLNHLSAEFLLTNEFKGLQYLSFMYTQVNHICQVASVLRQPITCEVLSLDGVAVRHSGTDVQTWEHTTRDLCVLQSLDLIKDWIHFKHLRVNATSLLGQSPTHYTTARQICKSSNEDHVRSFKTSHNKPPQLETLGVWEFSALEIKEMGLDLSELRQLSVEVSVFNYGAKSRRGEGRWEEGFWSSLLVAGKKLEKVAISGLTKVQDILDLSKALEGLSPNCRVSFSRGIPEVVIEDLKRQRPMVEFVRAGPVIGGPSTQSGGGEGSK